MSYWIISPAIYADGAVLSAVPDGGPKDYQYDKGKSLLKGYLQQDKAVMCMDPQYPDQIKLYDILPSLDTVLVVNTKVKRVLETLTALEPHMLEYLPITIWDHHRQPISTDYFIMNPLGSVDFIDMEKSEYRRGVFDETQIDRVKNLVINAKAVASNPLLFRATTKMDQFFIHDDVRKAFEAAGIKGYKLYPADGWDGLEI